MHILKGNHRNVQGLLERGWLMVELANGGFRDVYTGEMYTAQEYKVAGFSAVEIITTDTDTNVVYPAFEPDFGECERIGMPVARP